MPSRTEIVSLYLDAQKTRDEAKLTQLEQLMTDDVTMASPMGSTNGKDKIVGRMRKGGSGQMAQMMEKLTWGTPTEANGQVSVGADLPPGLPLPFPIKGIDLKFSFSADDRINRIDFSARM
jgi:hypothetical protein